MAGPGAANLCVMDIETSRRTSSAFGCFTVAFIVLVVLWLFLMITGKCAAPWSDTRSVSAGGEVAEKAGSDSAAIAACQDYAAHSLGVSSSAFFIKPVGPFKHMAERVGDRSFQVASIAVLKDAAGGRLDRPFTCTVTYTGNGHWRLDNLEVLRPEQPYGGYPGSPY